MRLRHLAITLTLLFPLTLANLAHAAGRVFFDDFESGNTNQWTQDSDRNRCVVVTSALDGGPGPHAGTHMLRCNWNGTVAWDNPAAFEALVLNGGWNYNQEIFLRWWTRVDQDFAGNTGPKYWRIGPDLCSFGDMHASGEQTFDLYSGSNCTQIGSTFWGGGSHAADKQWHKTEFYIKIGSGTSGMARMWEDGVLLWEARNTTTTKVTGAWAYFIISSNWSGPAGCCDHDASNHIYWDDFEIYSDTGTGATGLMSDATINVGGSGSGGQTVPNSPGNLQIH